MKIGITLGLKTNDESIWTNGIKQNVLMLVDLLMRSKKKYEVCILNIFDVDFTKKPKYLEGIDIFFYKDKMMDMDLIISMGGQLYDKDLKKFKEKKNKKLVSYKCGNDYVLAMENILFKNGTDNQYFSDFDELWYVPQQDEVNKDYYSILYKTKSLKVPFIWSPKFLEQARKGVQRGFESGHHKKSWEYDSNKKKKIIGIMEPNLNIVKFCLLPSMIVEECYRSKTGKEYIEKLRITNSEKIKDDKLFMSHIKTFDLFKDKKISAESRYQTAYVLTQFLDVLVCHQILNPLNYLYLDATYLGYPVLHNAYMCEDLGYYYDASNIKDGAKMLSHILENHDKNIESYNSKNKLVLNKYRTDNEDLIASYDTLIENLWKDGNSDLVYNYKTNLFE